MPKKYTPEERERAVRMVFDQLEEYGSITASCQAVGSRLGIARESLRRWCQQHKIDAGQEPGVTSAEHEELRELKKKVRRLEEDNAILKAAATFFAGELDPRK